MADQGKRRTLKIISVGAATLGNSAIASTTAESLKEGRFVADTPDFGSINTQRLEIQVIAGRSVSEDTVIFRNLTEEAITVSEFVPNCIALDDQMMDLNQLCESGNLTVEPGYPIASTAASWKPVRNLNQSCNYLWCDGQAIALQSEQQDQSNVRHYRGSAYQTSVLTLDAVILERRAIPRVVPQLT